jgi:hypothetical protein
VANEQQQTPGRIKRWLEKLKQRNERASGISRRVGSARRADHDHRAGSGGDGPGIGGF